MRPKNIGIALLSKKTITSPQKFYHHYSLTGSKGFLLSAPVATLNGSAGRKADTHNYAASDANRLRNPNTAFRGFSRPHTHPTFPPILTKYAKRRQAWALPIQPWPPHFLATILWIVSPQLCLVLFESLPITILHSTIIIPLMVGTFLISSYIPLIATSDGWQSRNSLIPSRASLKSSKKSFFVGCSKFFLFPILIDTQKSRHSSLLSDYAKV